ncbi:hypothetical protein EDB83DRAFT_2520249 [Lactarius deliciosus]|nr:hypothetical protein EDB83DRAFT_2520249 [Lactarius deliciosus]
MGSYDTLWDSFIPSFQCPHRVERIGVLSDGGKWVRGMERIARQEKCVIYSFGINGCKVWEYDFTVDSFDPEIEYPPNMKERARVFPWALGGRNARGPDDSPKYYTLAFRQLDGGPLPLVTNPSTAILTSRAAEFDTLAAFLAVELHAWDNYAKFDFFHDWWAALEAAVLDRGELGSHQHRSLTHQTSLFLSIVFYPMSTSSLYHPVRPSFNIVILITVAIFGNLKWLFVILPRRLWTSLHTWLMDEEAFYVLTIQEQLELFKKWGPRDDAVDP